MTKNRRKYVDEKENKCRNKNKHGSIFTEQKEKIKNKDHTHKLFEFEHKVFSLLISVKRMCGCCKD